ncbi:hypothetical protein F0562_000113 [Nyssa sinensis]|uniref:Uncharacterized protein n=1 Tax=Nyssa sinensis TaxID=561372 RepID=A0A5J5BZQ4_9ASTE|nr:hypothetical protein F0562_000113 [Nyssa sinensis]
MATTCKSICESSVKSQSLLLFLGLLLIVPLFARPLDFSGISMASTTTTKLHGRQILSSAAASTTTTTTIPSTTTTDRKFKAAAHEVPSGPNPESNRAEEKPPLKAGGGCVVWKTEGKRREP